ncbi:MAG TPA: hypothetical protein VHY37_10640 [Tepidisphaeraceae bacterium]|jgi:hypothetical protein|nr:hypothetical protein [Tepidisphaeraceae bacterium]
MSEKVEGTVILDGLVQGKIPALPGTEQRLRDWVQFARSAKLAFNLEIAGGTFGFLADQTPVSVADLGHDPAETIKAAMGELLKVFPPAERAGVFSTLRSVEYRRAEEVQTLYPIAPDGTVIARSRTVSAQTAAPPTPMRPRERALAIAVGAVLLLAVIMVSSLFINYRTLFTSLKSQLRPLDAAHFPVDASVYQHYFTIDAKEPAPDGQGLILTLRRVSRPVTRPSTQPLSDEFRLASQAMDIGYIRCEFFDENNQFMGYAMIRIKPLRDAEAMKVEIPFDLDRRPSSVVLTY